MTDKSIFPDILRMTARNQPRRGVLIAAQDSKPPALSAPISESISAGSRFRQGRNDRNDSIRQNVTLVRFGQSGLESNASTQYDPNRKSTVRTFLYGLGEKSRKRNTEAEKTNRAAQNRGCLAARGIFECTMQDYVGYPEQSCTSTAPKTGGHTKNNLSLCPKSAA
ncbi:hypothetical protein GC207_06480 [bacterium]|nr:hypothetical protein [bacterium]